MYFIFILIRLQRSAQAFKFVSPSGLNIIKCVIFFLNNQCEGNYFHVKLHVTNHRQICVQLKEKYCKLNGYNDNHPHYLTILMQGQLSQITLTMATQFCFKTCAKFSSLWKQQEDRQNFKFLQIFGLTNKKCNFYEFYAKMLLQVVRSRNISATLLLRLQKIWKL